MLNKLNIALVAVALATPVAAEDFGQKVDQMLADESGSLFGIAAPLGASAPEVGEDYRQPTHQVADAVALAEGLAAEYLTRDAADSADMLAFFPADNPTHLIYCVEGDREEIAAGKLNPGVQRVALSDGKVETIVRGTAACDGIRTTAWGTILFTEEEDDGGAYELIDPLNASEITISDRSKGETTDPSKVVRRAALPTMAWEGIAILDNGVVYAGDELRPGSDAADADGGAIFKFLPATPYSGGAIDSLDASPFAAGTTYAMQVQCYGDEIQFGQGCEVGAANWVEVNPAQARSEADSKGATGYYRPEDLHADPVYSDEGVRFCWTNTGNEGASFYAEVMCAVDRAPLEISAPGQDNKFISTTSVTRFIEGDKDFNSFDNLDFQPQSGILYVIEDHDNGDIFACLRDGLDRDLMTDGCIRVLSVKDTSAEPTGFIFSADGEMAYVAIQHSDDAAMEKVDDYGTDDIIKITGFKIPTK